MTAEVLVVGGGLAGAAASIELARAGQSVTLIEREPAPVHKVCGEFLSAEALCALARLGIAPEALGAMPIDSVRLAGSSRASESKLPFAAMSLTRRTLDEALLRIAEDSGVNLLRGCNVEALTPRGSLWQIRMAGHAENLSAPNLFLATGKHDLRGLPRPRGVQGDLIAFKMYWRLTPAQQALLAAHVELLLFRGGYAGLQPVENNLANLCCVISKQAFQELGGNWKKLLAHMCTECPHLEERLQGATPTLDRPLALSSIPYGFVRQTAEPGLWALGDQAAVIPSFTGDGMSIALHSGLLAVRRLLAGSSSTGFQHALHNLVAPQVRFATTLSRMMVSPLGQSTAETAVRLWPGVLRFIAQRTRLDDRA